MLKRTPRLLLLGAALVGVLLIATGCGSSSSNTTASGTTSASAGGTSAPEGTAALAADAKSAATGDIPDSQNFLTLKAPRLRISMIYPEGWTVQETASAASIRDKNNLVRITLSNGAAPTTAAVQAQIAALKSSTPGLTTGSVQAIALKSGPAVKATYTTQSAPNPVTGKQVTLMVDRYSLSHGGRVAIVELGTPQGVDNVDAYKRMIASFKWL
ncbi:MAG TPA: hypothetical protein VGO14_09625 [Solirubrobacteraceae bacterium]|jgi:hypothetical protein|nr:hypothetical protein [Solirubrobacteraceae bacterium]